MASPNTNNARPRGSWSNLPLDKLRLILRFRILVFGIIVLMMGANAAFAQTQRCAIINGGNVGGTTGVSPAYLANQDGRADEGCTILITLNADGSIRTTHPNPATSFDNGFDDNMIAVVNNTAKTVTGLQLTSTTTVDIFGFDGDGACSGPPGWTFSALGPNPNCAIATDPNHYGPAGINFTVFNPFSGIVHFGNGGIAPGGSAFFSLEGADLNKIVIIVIPGLAITKQVSVVGGGAALPGGQLDYLVHVVNPSNNPPNFQASSVVITDDLSSAGVGRLTLVNPAPTMNGATTGVTVVGSKITADYSTSNGALQPGQSIDLRFRAQIAAAIPAGTTITNTGIVTWNTPTETASASASVVIGGVPAPGAGTLIGTAWLDANFNKVPDVNEQRLQGWTVTLFLNGVQLQSVLTDANGVYRFSNVAPTDGTPNRYEMRFSAPGAGPNTAKLGIADSAFTNSLQRITGIAVPSNSSLQNLNLPIAPNGVVYNSLTRAPIAGATLAMLRAGAPLPASCFDDTAQQGQITQAGGYYRFDLNFSDPACPAGNNYLIQVTAPGGIYVAGESRIIPPASNAATAPFSVPACPGGLQDALPAVPFCEAQGSEFAPPPSVPPGSTGTKYYLNLTLDGSSVPGSNQIYNNHIPVDQQIAGAFSITKTTPLLNVTRGQLVPYTITIGSVLGASAQGVQIVDRYPAGFRYVKGSARMNGVPTEPTVTASQLVWSGISFDSNAHPTITLLLAVGAGVSEGEFTNRAQVLQGVTGQPMSGEATATVRVVADQTFDCTDVFGKVFDDVNRNGFQDPGEKGLPGVRVVTAQGLAATTDQYGRFHITCAMVPNGIRGSNFVLKLDDRTLPSGFRMSTDLIQIKHATAGKALKFDFGASIYRVVAVDLSDAAFEPGSTEIRVQWRPRVDVLLGELRKAPSVLRLSYVADTEDAALVERRMQAIKRQLTEAWDSDKDRYMLTIEPEVFWRRGAPPKRSDLRVPESR